jgi:hypothetical protein
MHIRLKNIPKVRLQALHRIQKIYDYDLKVAKICSRSDPNLWINCVIRDECGVLKRDIDSYDGDLS